jgi:hypothetical protein
MATETTNYGLTKPEVTDPVDIIELNTNFDILDRELKRVDDLVSSLQDADEMYF